MIEKQVNMPPRRKRKPKASLSCRLRSMAGGADKSVDLSTGIFAADFLFLVVVAIFGNGVKIQY